MISLKNISRSKKQVLILYLCTLWGVFAGVIASIINTRFINSIDYGDVRYVQNIINLMSSLVLFGYFLSGSRLLAISNNYEHSRRIKGMMTIILVIAVLIIMLGCVVFSFMPTNKQNVPLLFLISIPICGNVLYTNYINTTAQGDNQINHIAFIRILPSLIYLPLAYWIYSTWGATSSRMILLQWGIGSIVGIVVIFATKPLFKNLYPIWIELKEENKSYGLQLYIGSLVMVATNYLAGISIGIFNDDNSQVGFYTLALTVTSPLQQLPSIIGTTYFKKFATEPCIPPKVMRYTLLLSTVSCIFFLILIKPLVYFLYSEEYLIVGTYASWLAIGFTIHGIGDMINRYLGSHGKGKEIRNASIANGIFKIFGYTILVYLLNTPGALITTIICDFIYSSMVFYYYRKMTKNNLLNV